MQRIRRILVTALASLAVLAAPTEVEACPWHYETYHAEAHALPCVLDALVGSWPRHTPEFYEAQAEAFDYALAWAPYWTEGLDARGVVHMRLGQFDRAREVMTLRHAVAPAAYASHANLGTLYTFSGDHEAALRHIDEALAKDPQAHFGREKYHRKLVEFLLAAKADPAVPTTRNFLGVEVSAAPGARDCLEGGVPAPRGRRKAARAHACCDDRRHEHGHGMQGRSRVQGRARRADESAPVTRVGPFLSPSTRIGPRVRHVGLSPAEREWRGGSRPAGSRG